jgi:Ca-activated chloride channel homolog
MQGSLTVIQAVTVPLVIATLAAALRASDGQVQGAGAPVFRSETSLVGLHVNVFDRDGRPIPKLAREHFEVLEEGRLQEISVFSNEDLPVTVGLVIDNSSSMITRHKLVVAGAMAFADSSHPDDERFVVSFTEDVRLALPPSVDFTSSRSLLQGTLLSLRPGGKTALYDAIVRALDHIERADRDKRVIIVLSDGKDTASRHTREQMLRRVELNDATVFAVGMGDHSTGDDADPGLLRRLARVGGGTAYSPKSERDIVEVFEEIAANVRRGYTIGYVPRGTDAAPPFMRIQVKVQVPGRRGLTVRHRPGYLVPAP